MLFHVHYYFDGVGILNASHTSAVKGEHTPRKLIINKIIVIHF